MTNAKTITANTVEPAAGAALWRINLSAYERETTAYAAAAADYSEACKLHQYRDSFKLLEPAELAHADACDKLHEAREALIKTPAPDTAALLLKLDILADYLTDCDSEDKERFAAVAADVRRLAEAA